MNLRGFYLTDSCCLLVSSLLLFHHITDPAVLGVEPVNEPWELTPIKWLKKFYWDAYLIVKRRAPYWKFIMHDSFRFTPEVSLSCSTLCCMFTTTRLLRSFALIRTNNKDVGRIHERLSRSSLGHAYLSGVDGCKSKCHLSFSSSHSLVC